MSRQLIKAGTNSWLEAIRLQQVGSEPIRRVNIEEFSKDYLVIIVSHKTCRIFETLEIEIEAKNLEGNTLKFKFFGQISNIDSEQLYDRVRIEVKNAKVSPWILFFEKWQAKQNDINNFSFGH